MDNIGKPLIIAGIVFILAGSVFMLLSRLNTGIPRLPGDIYIKKDNFTFYFPLGWSVLLSIILTLAFTFMNLFLNKK